MSQENAEFFGVSGKSFALIYQKDGSQIDQLRNLNIDPEAIVLDSLYYRKD